MQLPYTRHKQHHDLRNTIPHRPRIRRLTQVPIIRLAFSLILLFHANILQLLVQIANLARQLARVRPVLLDVGFRGADDDVEVETDVGVGLEPAGGVVG